MRVTVGFGRLVASTPASASAPVMVTRNPEWSKMRTRHPEKVSGKYERSDSATERRPDGENEVFTLILCMCITGSFVHVKDILHYIV